MKVIFDMDGTIADLYGVDGWLEMLRAFDETPYKIAKPLVNMSRLARAIHKAQANGIMVTVVSWTAKDSTDEYDKMVANTKLDWLTKHLPSVHFDEIAIVPYGVNKSMFADENDILIDDNQEIRENFVGSAIEPNEMFEILRDLGVM